MLSRENFDHLGVGTNQDVLITQGYHIQGLLKPPWRMEGHRAARKMNLFYRGCVNHNFKVPPCK